MRRSFTTNQSYVYVIEHEHNFHKIGKADDPQERLNALQTSCPYELYLRTTIDAPADAEYVEGAIHEDCWGHHIRGEWFELPDEKLAALADIQKIHADVVEHHPDWSLETHYEMSADERESYIMTVLDEQVADIVDLIQCGNFPQSNLKPTNPLIDERAKKAEVMPKTLIENVNEKLINE